jgi:hypothetical protein
VRGQRGQRAPQRVPRQQHAHARRLHRARVHDALDVRYHPPAPKPHTCRQAPSNPQARMLGRV